MKTSLHIGAFIAVLAMMMLAIIGSLLMILDGLLTPVPFRVGAFMLGASLVAAIGLTMVLRSKGGPTP